MVGHGAAPRARCHAGRADRLAARSRAASSSKTETLPDGTVASLLRRARTPTSLARSTSGSPTRTIASSPKRVWPSATGSNEPRYRTRVVWARPLGELGDGILVGWGDKGDASPARHEGHTGRGRALHGVCERSIGSPRGEVLVRGRTSLGRPTFDRDAAHLSFGSGIEAYARAQDEKQLLTTPRLPALKRVGAVGLPPNDALATACFVVPILLSVGVARVHPALRSRASRADVARRRHVRARRRSRRCPAGFAELFLVESRRRGSIRASSRSAGSSARCRSRSWSSRVVVGIMRGGREDARGRLRGAPPRVRRAGRRDRVRHRLVARLRGGGERPLLRDDASLGADRGRALLHERAGAHVLRRDLGLCARRAARRARSRAWLFFLALAAAATGSSTRSCRPTAARCSPCVLNVVLASVFVAVVRRSLRHGVVEDAVRAILPEHRRLFRVGRPGLFFALVGRAARPRVRDRDARRLVPARAPSPERDVRGRLERDAGAARRSRRSACRRRMPLDVAIDDYGVTFAGAARAWSRIRRFDVMRGSDRARLRGRADRARPGHAGGDRRAGGGAAGAARGGGGAGGDVGEREVGESGSGSGSESESESESESGSESGSGSGSGRKRARGLAHCGAVLGASAARGGGLGRRPSAPARGAARASPRSREERAKER